MTDCVVCDAVPTECIDCQDETVLTPEERERVQCYAMESLARDPDRRPEKNSRLESVIYWWQEAMRPAPPAVKEQSKLELISALRTWRTA